MSQTRTRLVNFRLTDEEFEQLKTASSRQGARCVSEFVRHVILTAPNRCPASSSYDDNLMLFERRVATLEQSMTRLIESFSSAQPQRVNSGN